MRKLFIALPLSAIMACTSGRPVATAPPQAPTVQDATATLSAMGGDAVLWQNNSAEAYWLYRQAYESALSRMMWNIVEASKRYADDAPRRPMAVIVDIDETVLDNSPYQVEAIRNGRTFDQNDWKVWADKAAAKASPGALDFLKLAKAANCEVFYITNRDVRERASTLKNLSDLGFPFADEAHLLLMDGSSDKTERRARVRATHDVVLLVGDQLRDFDERFKDRSVNAGKDIVEAMADSLSKYFVLLPNPMYGTYRDAIQGKGTDVEKLQRMRSWFEQGGK